MSRIIRYCKSLEEHVGENVFDCSRPHVMGNPFTHITDKKTLASIVVRDRDEAIRLFEPYFDNMVALDDDAGALFRETFDRMYDAYKKYDEVFLGCWCKPEETCHCDIIRKKILQRSMRDKLKALRREG